jgi:hypothetical protein
MVKASGRGPAIGDRPLAVRHRPLLEAGADSVEDPLLLREVLRLELGVDQLAVQGDFKAAAASGDQLEVADFLLVGRQQLARQTEGLRLVVSHRAILEFHIHLLVPPWGIVHPQLP